MNFYLFCNILRPKLVGKSQIFCLLSVPYVVSPVNNCCSPLSGTFVFQRNFSCLKFVINKKTSDKKLLSRILFHRSFKMDKCNMSNLFRLSDYDCIGFDLDNTICEYKIRPMVEMEYDMLSKYLVEKKGYDYKTLYQPLSEVDIDFLQRGLFLDLERGNVLKVDENGIILLASHGTTQMTADDIEKEYGKTRQWNITTNFCNDMLSAWDGPVTTQLRTLLDYFDMPASLLFARAVDNVDCRMGRNNPKPYTVGADVLEALINLYNRDYFSSEKSGYFKELKSFPCEFIKKCPPSVIEWLRNIKSEKPVFLITGSNVDYASFTASFCLGEDWRSLFDIVVCYARKPGFFTERRPFLSLDGMKEGSKIESEDLEFNNIYSQGNWQDLYKMLARKTGIDEPKCLYIGDNIVQDVYTPSKLGICDTLAVVEELWGEAFSISPEFLTHPSESAITSRRWGSYFKNSNSNTSTVWGKTVRTHAKICVSTLRALAMHPLDHEFETFNNNREHIGYYPIHPSSIMRV